MEFNLRNNFTTSLLIFTLSLSSFSQEPLGVRGNKLWIKGNKLETTSIQSTYKEKKELFNFNPIVESTDVDMVYKNILENKYSLFVVFRSDLDQETTLLRLKTFDEKIEITNKRAGDKDAVNYKNTNSKKGMLLSYMASSNKKIKRKSNVFSILNLSAPSSHKGKKNELMELLYYPRLLSKTEQNQLETYLSIKYGISLLGEADYIDSNAKKVWDYKENKAYCNRVTGIGRDDYFDLYQKQSGNSLKDGLFIGLKNFALSNEANKETITDKTYLLWGDNNRPTILKAGASGQGDFKSMERIWKMQATVPNQPDIPTQMILDKKDFYFGPRVNAGEVQNDIWLAISENAAASFDYQKAKYFRAKEEEGKLIFDNIIWDKDKSGSDLFTFIEAPDLFVTYTAVTPNCNLSDKGKFDIKIFGGVMPFTMNINSGSYSKTVTGKERIFQISDIPVGEYQIVVKDYYGNESTQQFQMDPFKEFAVSVDSEWQLSNNKTILTPRVKNDLEEILTYKWEYQGRVVSTQKDLEADNVGEYQLTVTNKQGCEKRLSSKVKNSLGEELRSWSVYPNPTEERKPFTINFNLEKFSNVNIAIYDISSRLVSSKNLGSIKFLEYTDSLSTAGVYMVVVTIDGKVESAKLIVK